MKAQLAFVIAIALTVTSCKQDKEIVKPVKIQAEDTIVPEPEIQELNLTDSLPNQRFGKSAIINSKFDTKLLFGIWVKSNDDPACDFQWNEKVFSFCDYDGNPDRLYKVNGDSLFLDNPYLIFKGRIINATKDTLIIHWQENEKPETFVRWTS
jgi:hypothetical protein